MNVTVQARPPDVILSGSSGGEMGRGREVVLVGKNPTRCLLKISTFHKQKKKKKKIY